jgi:hypothetical protein
MYLKLDIPELNLNVKQSGAFGLSLGNPNGLSKEILIKDGVSIIEITPTVNPVLIIPTPQSQKIVSLVINNKIYQLSESVEAEQLAPDEFIYNPYAQQVAIAQYSDPKYIQVTSPTNPVTVSIPGYSTATNVYIGGTSQNAVSYTVKPHGTLIGDLEQGQAVYNPASNELIFIPVQSLAKTITTAPQILAVQISGVKITTPTTPIKVSVVNNTSNIDYDTDYIDKLPTVLQWLPLLGNFNYSTSLEQSQNGEMRFETWFSYKNLVLKHLCRGAKFEAFGIGWRVDGLQINEKMRSELSHPKIEVSISLTDPHWWLDTEVPLVPRKYKDDPLGGLSPILYSGDWKISYHYSASSPGVDPECLTNSPSQPKATLAESRTLTWLCGQAGGMLSGMEGEIPVPNDVSPEEGRIPRSEIQSRLRQNNCFLDLSDSDTVYCKKWDSTKQWLLQETDILSPISVSCSTGKQRKLTPNSAFQQEIIVGLPNNITPKQTITLKNEDVTNIYGASYIWPKQEVTGEFLEKSQEQVEENQGNRAPTLPEYRMRQRKYEQRTEDPDIANTPPDSVDINDLSVSFWKSGQNYVKVKREIKTIDGFEFQVTEQKYAFNGPLAKDIYEYSQGVWKLKKADVRSFWGLIEETTTQHFYSSGFSAYEGLYLGYEKSGWRFHVFATEPEINISDSEADPTLQYPTLSSQQQYIDKGSGATNADLQTKDLANKAYTPQRVPIFEKEKYYHEPMEKYYKDAAVQTVDEVKWCMPDGTSRRLAAIDKTFQQPYIVTAREKVVRGLSSMEDPRNPTIREFNQKRPDGQKEKPEFPPLTTGTESSESYKVKINRSVNTPGYRNTDDSEKDTFTAYTRSASTGGNGSGFGSQISENRVDEVEGRPESSRRLPPIWERVEEENPTETEEKQNQSDPKRYRYKVWTPLAPDKTPFDQLVSGSMSFPYAKTLSEVRTAIKTNLDIENARNSYTEGFTTFFNPSMRPGDQLTYFVNGERRKRRILSISPSVVFQGNLNNKPFATGTMQLSVGCPIEVDFILEQELIPNSATDKDKLGTGYPLEVWLDPTGGAQGAFEVENIPSRLTPPSTFL